MEQNHVRSGKTTAIISYLTLLGTIIAIFMNLEPKNQFARFHIRQAFGIFVIFYILGALVSYFNSWFVSMPFYLFFAVLWGYGFVTALQGVTRPVPFVGHKFQEWFTFIN